MMHMNIRSMKANIGLFAAYLNTLEFRFKLLALIETWLDNKNHDIYNIFRYNMVSNFRRESAGGGVSIPIHESLCYKERTYLSLMNDAIECSFTEVYIWIQILIDVIYRPPNTPVQQFNEYLRFYQMKLKPQNYPVTFWVTSI